ncbi:hypothetical protein Hdeb2414_s0024g00651381 [Helianthus debilis subsp. tardiflorus]
MESKAATELFPFFSEFHEASDQHTWEPGLSITLFGTGSVAGGRIFGGDLAGLLTVASPVQGIR